MKLRGIGACVRWYHHQLYEMNSPKAAWRSPFMQARAFGAAKYCIWCHCLVSYRRKDRGTSQQATREHLLPRWMGGNINHQVVACLACNQQRGDKLLPRKDS